MEKDIYRERLKAPLNKKVLKFLSSLKDDLWIAEEDIVGTEVHNIMLFEQGILNENEIKLILGSLEKLKQKLSNNQLNLDQKFEDIHPLIEKYVIDDIGLEIGGKIHTGRSRNDQVSVDIRLKIRYELNVFSNILFELFDILLELSKKTIQDFMPLYTHLQKGQLGVFAHYLNNYNAQILRSLERIEEVFIKINNNPLGACAIGGTNIKIDRKRTAELLGFQAIIENSIDAVSSKDYILETLMCLTIISIQCSRMAEDLLLWSSKEFDYIELDDQFCSVSSVMPQKKNPDTIELIRSKSSKVVSNLFTASIIIRSTPTGYFRDFQELKILIKKSFNTLYSILDMYIGIFSTIKINRGNMKKSVENSYILALDLAELLVNEFNIPFRQSHQIIANLVKETQDPNDFLNKENIEKSIFKIVKKKIVLPNNFTESLKNLDLCLEKRISQGSPSKFEVEKVVNTLEKNKNQLVEKYLKRIRLIEKADKYRKNLIKKLIA